MTDFSAIQGWVSEVTSTMTGLPTALSAAAPSGDFGAVLDSALAVLNGAPAGGAAGEIAPSTSSSSTSSSNAPASTTAVPASSAGSGSSVQAQPAGLSGSMVVSEAEKFLGVPYVWGGSTPSGFDCSGLVQYVYGQLGVSLPRTSEEQALVGTSVPDLADAQPGDLVFFAGSDGTPSAPGHVGIYLGNGEMIDAPYTGTDVQIQPVGDPVAIRRVLGSSSSSTSPVGASGSIAEAANAIGSAAAGAASQSLSASTPSSLTPLFLAAAKTYGVPADVLEAVAKEESDFTPSAVSSAGAQGLMQLMPQTASSLGVNSFDPSQAIDGAASLLSGYLKQFGSLSEALAAYNAGPNAVEQYGGVPPYGQTEAYVQGVLNDIGQNNTNAATSSSVSATAGASSTTSTGSQQ